MAYDIAHPKRLRTLFRAMHGFGDPVQYSVFLCVLSAVERQQLRERLTALLNLREDRALVIDLGEAQSRTAATLEVLGVQLGSMPDDFQPTIV